MSISEEIEETRNIDPSINPEISELFKVGAHIGYSKQRRHPKMKEFIFGTRNNVEIFDLEKTLAKLKSAELFLKSLGESGKMILWVGTKPAAAKFIEEAGKKTNMPYVYERWLGGTITNFKVIESRLSYLDALEKEIATRQIEKYVKKERVNKIAESRKLSRMFGGLRSLKRIPDAIFIVDTEEEKTAFSEARRKNIPIAGILNVDCDPTGINYVIPANDNASAVINLIINKLVVAYEAGRAAALNKTV